jgi:hypothetical protein
MSGNLITLVAEGLVAVLLVITIGYCMVLNSRLKRLRADEQGLRATISELVTATEIAERAIGGLKEAAVSCDRTLASRMREAEHFSVELAREIGEGQAVLSRIKQIATAARKPEAGTTDVAAQAALPPPLPRSAGRDDATVTIGKADVRTSLARLEEAVTAKFDDAGKSAIPEPGIALPADAVRTGPAGQSRAANRIEELRVMAEQARERLKELRKVNSEKAA